MQTRLFTSLMVGAMASILARIAPAQTTSDTQAGGGPANQLQEVIVTAQKRAENMQDVPLAISAVSAADLEDRHVTNFDDLARVVPSVTFSQSTGESRIGIRGITFDNIGGTASEPRVGFYLDGVYVATTQDISETLFDVDRFEVSRGPQGTLFGRNTVGGAVSLISRDPTESFSGYAETDVGNYNSTIVNAAVSGPLAENVSARLAIHSSNHGGYGRDFTTDQPVDDLHDLAIRGKVKVTLGDKFTVVLSADYSHRDDNVYLFYAGQDTPAIPRPALFGPAAGSSYRDIYSDPTPSERSDFYGFGSNIKWDIGNALSLVSVTGYRHAWTGNDYNATFGALTLVNDYSGLISDQLSEEIRLQKDFARGHAMVGAYYLNQIYSAQQNIPINTLLFGGPDFLTQGLRWGGNQRLDAPAAFAQFNYEPVDQLELTVGARYSRDKKEKYEEHYYFNLAAPEGNGSICRQPCNLADIPASAYYPSASNTWSNFTPSASLLYHITSEINAYIAYSKGFKSGGFNLGLDGGTADGYQPETITDYEGGIKSQWLDRTLQINVAGFYYNYKNLQVQKINADLTSSIINAAAAKLYGIESEMVYLPRTGLRFDFSGSLEHTEYTQFTTYDPTAPATPVNLKGNRLEYAPNYTANYGAQYTLPTTAGNFTLRGEGYSAGREFFDPYNKASVSSPATTIVNASLAVERGNYRASAYVNNLTNVFQLTGASVSTGLTGFPVQGSFLPPRTYGVTFRVQF